MSNLVQEKIDAYKKLLQKIIAYEEAINLMDWDLKTVAPKHSIEARSETIGVLSSEVFKISTSKEMEELLTFLLSSDKDYNLEPIVRRSLEEQKKEFDRYKRIPADKHQEFVVLTTKANNIWEEAKDAADFKLFQPYLQQVVQMLQEFTELWGYKEHPYDALLEMYEPGMTVKQLDIIFQGLKEALIPLVQEVAEKKAIIGDFLRLDYDLSKQKELNEFLVDQMGYDFQAGRLDPTVHPFQTTINRGDKRITTKYVHNDLTVSLFSTLHEAGHAIYEQSMDSQLDEWLLAEGASMGIHESQSLFWENIVGRSSEYWDYYYQKLISYFPEQLKTVTKDEFYRAINAMKASFIRIEADELTYHFHIILRYELEKELIAGNIQVKDLPKAWNDKMKEYLGVVPENDAQGVLQDMHWSDGSLGYFPSYSLGYLYAAQFTHQMGKELPEWKEQIKKGNLISIKEWYNEKIHRHGRCKTTNELVKEVTGEELNPDYLTAYLKEKINQLYQ